MSALPTLADRVWYAYHCLPRDSAGRLPTFRDLEGEYQMATGTLSRTVAGERTEHRRVTFDRLATALRVTTHWLDHGGDGGPIPTGPLPPRPGTQWITYGELPGWADAVEKAPKGLVPPAAFVAAAAQVPPRPVEAASPLLALGAALCAWTSITHAEREHYSTRHASAIEAATPRRQLRPPVKRATR